MVARWRFDSMSKQLHSTALIAVLAAACISATTCSEPSTLELFLVVTTPTDPTAPLGLFQPRFSQCDDCARIEFASPGGGRFSGFVEKSARVRIPASEIKEYRAYETTLAHEASARGWVLVAVPSEAAQARLAPLVEAFPFDRVLVRLDDTPVDVQAVTSTRGGVQLGVFKSPNEVKRFGEMRKLAVSFEPLTGANDE